MPDTIRNQALLTPAELRARLGEFYESLRQFNDGWYFESHETLEDLWMVTPWPEREFFQGIIQAAAAYVHLVRGEYPGTLKLLDAALDKLSRFQPSQFGVDVSSLIAGIRASRQAIAAAGPDALPDARAASIPAVSFNIAED